MGVIMIVIIAAISLVILSIFVYYEGQSGRAESDGIENRITNLNTEFEDDEDDVDDEEDGEEDWD